MKLNVLPVFLVFLAMGFADAMGPFVSLAKNEFHLSTAIAALIPFVGLSMFGLLSIPAGLVQNRKGKKFTLLLGLTVTLVGVLAASFGLSTFPRFLFTVVMIGAGAAIVQVAGNPLMLDVSGPGKFPRNLVLGQFIKSVGSLSGPVIPAVAARYFGVSWQVIFPIYSVALLITILSTAALRIRRDESIPQGATLRSCMALLGNGYVLAMTGAIFLYVGAEISVSAGIPLYLKEQFNVNITKVGLLGSGLFFVALTLGRLFGGVILNWVAPSKLLVLSCGVSLLGLVALFLPDKSIATSAIVLIGLGFANIFPLVFSAALKRMPERSNEISGLMVTAIVGGALLPLLMGVVADHSTVRLGFLVPIAAIVCVGAATSFEWQSKTAIAEVQICRGR